MFLTAEMIGRKKSSICFSHDLYDLRGKSSRRSDQRAGCDIRVSKFESQLCHNVHFRTNTIGKGKNPLYFQLWVK